MTLEPVGSLLQHVGFAALACALGLSALHARTGSREWARYAIGLIAPNRGKLVGMACFIMGGLHFVTLPAEGVFLKMGYLTLLLALFETACLAELFLPSLANEPAPVTMSSMRRTYLRQGGMLAVVFLLSIVLLYMSLMVVVGFTDTWTVGLLAAMMLAALAFMTMVRRL